MDQNLAQKLRKIDEYRKEIDKRWAQKKVLAKTVIEHGLLILEATTDITPEDGDFDNFGDMLLNEKEPDTILATGVSSMTSRYLLHKLRAVAPTPNYFEVSEPLALQLLHTDLRGVVLEDVNLPFGAFVILLPRGIFQIHSRDTGWHDATAMTVGLGYWRNTDLRKVFPTGHVPRVKEGPRIVVMTYGEPNENSKFAQDDAVLTHSIHLSSEGLAAVSDVAYPDEKVMRFIEGEPLSWDEHSAYATRLVANLSLYLSSPHRDVEMPAQAALERLRGKKGEKAKAKREKLRNTRVYIVGGKERLSVEDRATFMAGGTKSRSVRSVVRGHWRNQAHGKGRAERKLIWIRPHVRNRDAAAALTGRDYKVS